MICGVSYPARASGTLDKYSTTENTILVAALLLRSSSYFKTLLPLEKTEVLRIKNEASVLASMTKSYTLCTNSKFILG